MMKQLIAFAAAAACLAGLSSPLHAAGGAEPPYSFKPQLRNEASLQRGAKYFMNYCSGCHGLEFLRYQRMAKDLEMPIELVEDNLIFDGSKPGEHIRSAIDDDDAATWFGVAPPDLSLTARSRGPSWIYSYLLTFYADDTRPLGVNNVMLPGASMPHVLWPLEGWKALEHHEGDDHGDSGGHGPAKPDFTVIEEGQLDTEDYRKVAGDITNFLTYAAEPGKVARQNLGVKVSAYLIGLFILAYLLKREYWKDVH